MLWASLKAGITTVSDVSGTATSWFGFKRGATENTRCSPN